MHFAIEIERIQTIETIISLRPCELCPNIRCRMLILSVRRERTYMVERASTFEFFWIMDQTSMQILYYGLIASSNIYDFV